MNITTNSHTTHEEPKVMVYDNFVQLKKLLLDYRQCDGTTAPISTSVVTPTPPRGMSGFVKSTVTSTNYTNNNSNNSNNSTNSKLTPLIQLLTRWKKQHTNNE